MFLVVSTSLNSESRTRRLAKGVVELIGKQSKSVDLLDLSKYDLPIDRGTSRSNEEIREVNQVLGAAAGIVFVLPVYRSEVAIAARNLVQLSGSGLQRKVIGLISVAGDNIGNFSTLQFANTLMLEHRSFVLPDFVFMKSDSLSDRGLPLAGKAEQHLGKLVENLIRVTEALARA